VDLSRKYIKKSAGFLGFLSFFSSLSSICIWPPPPYRPRHAQPRGHAGTPTSPRPTLQAAAHGCRLAAGDAGARPRLRETARGGARVDAAAPPVDRPLPGYLSPTSEAPTPRPRDLEAVTSEALALRRPCCAGRRSPECLRPKPPLGPGS
jgi:hypothetical protein